MVLRIKRMFVPVTRISLKSLLVFIFFSSFILSCAAKKTPKKPTANFFEKKLEASTWVNEKSLLQNVLEIKNKEKKKPPKIQLEKPRKSYIYQNNYQIIKLIGLKNQKDRSKSSKYILMNEEVREDSAIFWSMAYALVKGKVKVCLVKFTANWQTVDWQKKQWIISHNLLGCTGATDLNTYLCNKMENRELIKNLMVKTQKNALERMLKPEFLQATRYFKYTYPFYFSGLISHEEEELDFAALKKRMERVAFKKISDQMNLSFGDVLWRQVDKKLPEDESEGKKVQKSWAIDVYLGYGMVYSLENKKGFIFIMHLNILNNFLLF